MNKILYMKVRRDLKNASESEVLRKVEELQKKFNIKDKSNIFEIENQIKDKEYAKIIKSV